MRFNRLRALMAMLLIFTNSHAQFTDVINSNRPGESMSAFSVGKTVLQTEAGVYYNDQEHKPLKIETTGFGIDLQGRYGAIFEQLEFVLDLQFQQDRVVTRAEEYGQSGVRQFVIGAKYLVYDPWKRYERKPNLYSWKANHKFTWRELIPAVGVYAGANLNLFNSPYYGFNEEKISPKVMAITQHVFGKYVFVTNFYVDRLITNYLTTGYVVTLTRGFNYRWSGFLENQGIQSDLYTDSLIRGGAAFLIRENIQVDASAGINYKDTPAILTFGVGVSWRFDDNYEDVFLRAPKDDGDKKKTKEEKKKEKEKKKRKDAIEGEGEAP